MYYTEGDGTESDEDQEEHQEEREVMSDHTPGPWRQHDDLRNRIIINGSAGYYVLDACETWRMPNRDDVRLMAAAPELLAALQEMREQFTSDGTDGQHAASVMADAAIKKARGGA